MASAGKDVLSFDNPASVASIVPVTLDILLTSIDECRHLIETYSTPNLQKKSSAALQYAKPLSLRERAQVEQRVADFWDEFLTVVENELTEAEEVPNWASDELYPFPMDALALLAAAHTTHIRDRLLGEHFSSFADSPLMSTYAISLLRLGPPSYRQSVLGQALLPLAISEMENFLAGLARSALYLYPNGLGPLPAVPTEIVRKYRANISSADIERWQVDQKIDVFIKQPPSEWRSSLSKWSRIDIAQSGGSWDILSEAI